MMLQNSAAFTPEPALLSSGLQTELLCFNPWMDPEGGQGVWTPLKNHKNIGFSSNTGLDPLKNLKATKPAFKIGSSLTRQGNSI